MEKKQITLPLTVFRAQELKKIVPILCFAPFPLLGLLFLPFVGGINLDFPIIALLIAITFLTGIGLAFFLVHTNKPAAIEIGHSVIAVRPFPVMGIPSNSTASDYPTNFFTAVEIIPSTNNENIARQCILKSRDGPKRDIRFSAPPGMSVEDTAAQLNRLLGYVR